MRLMRSLTVLSVLRRIRFISTVAFVSVLAIPAGAFAKSSALVVTPKTLNLGNEVFGVSGATSTAKPVTISNPKKSSASITIASFSLGGKDSGDFAVQDPHNCKDSAVTPDSSCIVEVTFTPTALGARSATFTATDSTGESTKAITVKGKGIAGALEIGVKEISFGRVQVGTPVTMQVPLTNANSVALAISTIVAKGTGFTQTNNCGATLPGDDSMCTVSVTFAPTSGKAKGTSVSGSLVLTDDAAGSPQKVKLSAVEVPAASGTPPPPTPTPSAGHPTPTPAPGGTPFAIKAAGIYVFNTAIGVTTPEIVEYQTTISSGATSQSTTVATGTGVSRLECTPNGKDCYGLDSADNIWGYSVQSSTGLLTSVGSPIAPPGGSAPNSLQFYDSSVLWAAATNFIGGTITFEQYPINSDGTLGLPTAATLTGSNFQTFSPPGSNVPTALWLVSPGSGGLFTLNVYPVNSNGTINETSIQTITVPAEFLFRATTAAFAYAVAGTFGNPQTLDTFSLSSNGELTANPTVALPATTAFWGSANLFVPGIGNTLDLFDEASFNLVVYPVSSNGVVGTSLQSMTLGGIPEFPFSESINTSSGAASLSLLPTLWVHPAGSTTISEFAIDSNGTIGASSGSVTTGAGVEALPEVAPLTYGIDSTAGAIYGYQVSSAGALTSLGSFAPAVPSGQKLEEAAPFKPIIFSANPVALFVYTQSNSGGAAQLEVYPLGSNGMPAAMVAPLDTISFTGQTTESYVILQNGQMETDGFGGL